MYQIYASPYIRQECNCHAYAILQTEAMCKLHIKGAGKLDCRVPCAATAPCTLQRVRLVRETTNATDPDAVMILDERNAKAGYRPPHMAASIAPMMDSGLIRITGCYLVVTHHA